MLVRLNATKVDHWECRLVKKVRRPRHHMEPQVDTKILNPARSIGTPLDQGRTRPFMFSTESRLNIRRSAAAALWDFQSVMSTFLVAYHVMTLRVVTFIGTAVRLSSS